MKRTTISCITMLLGLSVGCGNGSSTGTMDMSMTKTCASVTCNNGQICDTTTVMCVNPPFPSIASSMEIDRMGRAGVNTALTNPFGLYKSNGTAQTSDMTKAAYNADSNPSDWAANWAGAIKLSLGIFDALDDQCGNQLGYGLLTLPNYGLLSQVLAGDALQVDTSKTTCSIYLGLELNATGAMANTDCGGRTLTENTIDTTYAGLVGLPPVTGKGVTNGITAPAVAPSPTFPFFAPPQ